VFDAPGASPLATTHQRVDGAARIAFRTNSDGRTALADLFQRAPCRFLFPDTAPDEPVQAVLLTTSGGLTGGDRITVDVAAGAGSRVTLTTQAAEKLYRALPGDDDVRVEVRMRVGRDAWAEWLAQETILFENARLRRLFVADVEPQGRLLAVESVVFGRAAMRGEHFNSGLLHDAWRIRRGGRLIWADATHLQGDVAHLRAAPFGFGAARACATLLYVAEDAERQLAAVRERLQAYAGIGAATAFDGLLIVRLLADEAAALRAALMHVAGGIRELAAGLPARMPRVWYC
jgi:urease accessory protein